MTRKTKPGRTPEQRQAEREALLATVADKIDTLTSSGEWAAYLRFLGSFRHYSFNNTLLILVQCPHASHVAGYRTWQQHSRQVRKGEKGIKIIGYSTKKRTDVDQETGEETITRIPSFPVLTVFDVSQTEGDELPSDGFALPTGNDRHGVEQLVSDWLTRGGWNIETERIGGGVNGYTDHKAHRVALNETLEPAGRVAVLLHEAAHVVLHAELEPTEYQQHRGIYETEAESAAFVLASLLGVPADEKSIPYIAGWSSADRALIEANAANVRRAVNTIAAGIGLDAA
jgi:antirestriction protein ArdC